MGEIYRRARQVITWLGSHLTTFIVEAIHLIKRLANFPPVLMLPPALPSISLIDTAADVTWMDAMLLYDKGKASLKLQ
jgi:hypothetical protein